MGVRPALDLITALTKSVQKPDNKKKLKKTLL